MRRAKIVCTIGPATESAEQIQALVDAGMDVARINRSHGDTEAHKKVYDNVRAASKASRALSIVSESSGSTSPPVAAGDGCPMDDNATGAAVARARLYAADFPADSRRPATACHSCCQRRR